MNNRPDNSPVSLLPETIFSALPFWSDLNAKEQNQVASESQLVAQALVSGDGSKIAQGEHLTQLQSILEPKRVFVKFLRGAFRMSKRTAYRRIKGYNNVSSRLSKPIIQAASARGFNLIGESDDMPFGVYTDAIDKYPPPKRSDEPAIQGWLNKIDEHMKSSRKVSERKTAAPSDLLKQTYRFVDVRYRRLPEDQRKEWLQQLVGMLIKEMGVAKPTKISPISIPIDFKAVRGRPKEDGAATAAAA